jgi:hypothetical protein
MANPVAPFLFLKSKHPSGSYCGLFMIYSH